MTELEIKIIKFLLSSAVYSENAIMKNLGIDKNVLDKSLKILEDNGYLESYEEFIKRDNQLSYFITYSLTLERNNKAIVEYTISMVTIPNAVI